jgi:hypothetical protein
LLDYGTFHRWNRPFGAKLIVERCVMPLEYILFGFISVPFIIIRPVTILFFIFIIVIINIADMTLPFLSGVRFILVPVVEEIAKAAVIYKLVQQKLLERAITCMTYGVVDGFSQFIHFREKLNEYLEQNPNIYGVSELHFSLLMALVSIIWILGHGLFSLFYLKLNNDNKYYFWIPPLIVHLLVNLSN